MNITTHELEYKSKTKQLNLQYSNNTLLVVYQKTQIYAIVDNNDLYESLISIGFITQYISINDKIINRQMVYVNGKYHIYIILINLEYKKYIEVIEQCFFQYIVNSDDIFKILYSIAEIKDNFENNITKIFELYS